MRQIVAFPLLALAVILQSAIVSRITLLAGCADLVLVIIVAWALQEGVTTSWHWALTAGAMMAIVSGMPWGVYLAGYLAAVLLARALQSRIWQAPLLAMFAVTFLASLFLYFLSFAVLAVFRVSLPLGDTFSLIILPGVLLNMLLAVPVFWAVRDLSRWVNFVEVEE
jgi:rod shape-determining protein MreD